MCSYFLTHIIRCVMFQKWYIIKKYTHISYRICIVDNNSCKKERDKLKTFDFEAVDFLFLDKNGGYGSGNNEGIKYLIDKYDPQYILVMNPDVSIIENKLLSII